MQSIDGNTAAATVAYAMSDAAFIYPITPSSSMGEAADDWAAHDRKNIFGQVLRVTEMQSEGGAAGAVHGSLAAGALTTTFTASQGLLLMIPNMYKISGELMPCVFHVAARAIAGQALSIFGDHMDVMAARATGFAQLCSHSVQEAHDLALVSHLATLKASVPFIHFFDGFRTSAEISKIKLIPEDDMFPLIDMEAIKRHHQRALNPTHPHMRGTSQGPDIFFQMVEAANPYYKRVPGIVEECMRQVEKICGRSYHLFDYIGAPDAENVIVVMGSGAIVVEETVRYLVGKGEKVGVVKVHLYRPWGTEYFLNSLPKSVKKIAVLDRTKESGSLGEPLYLDVATSFMESELRPIIVGGRYGLGSKDFTPSMVNSIFYNLKSEKPKNHFTVGIDDDVSMTSLPLGPIIHTVPEGTYQCMFFGLGSDGTVGANKNAIKIIGDETDLYAQGYFSYDAHKAGGPTVSHLRFGPKPITSLYFIQEADYVAAHNPVFVTRFNMVPFVKDGGIFLLNCPWDMEQLERELPSRMKRQIAEKKVRFYTIDALEVSKKAGIGGRFNNVLQTAFFKLSEVIEVKHALQSMKKAIKKTYGKKGQAIVEKNWYAVDHTLEVLKKVDYPASWADLPMEGPAGRPEDVNAPEFIRTIMRGVEKLEGDKLPVSAFEAGGFLPMGTTAYEKRRIAVKIPIVDMDKCTQCNVCSFVCPHATIRPFLATEEELKNAPPGFESRKAKGAGDIASFSFRIQVAPEDCTGCSVCANSCPDEALTMTDVDTVLAQEKEDWEFALTLPQHGDLFDITSVKGSQFQQPLMEFSGACAGCGETPYVKLMTQLFGKRMIIANATGCSSIWGGSHPANPYTVDEKGRGPAWGNSLFEDNAEYGLGMAIASIHRRSAFVDKVKAALENGPVKMSDELRKDLASFVENSQDATICEPLSFSIPKLLDAEMGDSEALRSIRDDCDMIPKLSQWIVGGDGWAYDIGYGGLDHVLASGEDVNVVVLDTEVYSNTGGQTSKSTPMGAIAKFSSSGKKLNKKDLGMLAMSYQDVYVASVAMGASYNQCIRAFVEAEKYKGPSIIIAYSPCIAHGMPDLSMMIQQQELAVNSGYWTLYRFNPASGEHPFTLDSKKVKEDLTRFMSKENRFSLLQRQKPEEARRLQDGLQKFVTGRFERYKERAMTAEELAMSYAKMKGGMITDGKDKVMVLFGTETGNAEDLAKTFASMCKEREMDVECKGLDDIDFEEFVAMKKVVLFCSTAGQGEIPATAKDFYEELKQDHPKDLLSEMQFSVFGLGDTSYVFFCKAAKDINARLLELGAKPFVDIGLGDDLADDGFMTGFDEWVPNLWLEMGAPAPKDTGEPPVAQFKVEMDVKEEEPQGRLCPPGAKLVNLVVNSRMTPADYDRDIRHLEFDLGKSGLRYNLGDALAVYPLNEEEKVDEFLQFLKVKPETVLRITPLADADARKAEAFRKPMTVKSLFVELLDIFGRPKRRFFELLMKFAKDDAEKSKIAHLLSPEGKDEYKKLTQEDTVNHADVLRMFPSAVPSLEHLIGMIPSSKPRFYSIASAQSAMPTKLQLCIVIVDWKTASGELRYGSCTGYIRRLQGNGELVAVAVKPSTFTMPPSDRYPIVMAGLGTGMAPFRSFVQDRAHKKAKGKTVGPMALYYGARHKATDFLYGEELEKYHTDGVLTELRPAFSRDQAHKVYVQHKITEDPDMLYEMLFKMKGYFYLCGNGGRVPSDIRNAVMEVLMKKEGITKEDADARVTEMQLQGRYNIEVW